MRRILAAVVIAGLAVGCSAAGSTLPADFDTTTDSTISARETSAAPDTTVPHAPNGPLLDMAGPDGPAATGYAEAHGITPEQASEIIRWQAEVLDGLGVVVRLADERYVGSRFIGPDENTRHPGNAGLLVYIFEPTADEEAAVAELDESAFLIPAYADLATLQSMELAARASAIAENPGMYVEATADPATGEVTVDVSPLATGD